ncbi:MAG: phosphate acyltransferase PlsX [Elusimicrobia bacterium]|nr:phosphate acyltransferase PlsX [Elusimicrobiota bacterium]
MRIALDAHGGDNGLKPNVEAALLAAENLEHEIFLVGKADEIKEEIRRGGSAAVPERLHIVHAPDIIEMAKEPVEECRAKPDSSLMVCADMVKENKADGFVSAGNSGAIMVASLLKIKRINGILRPAIAIPYPTMKGVSALIDGGANMDTKPWHMAQFAIMGSIYLKTLFNVPNPSVGILSIGEEETKGNGLVLETIPLLKTIGINYYGPVEGRDVPEGLTDVVVTDGFTGNIALKLSEGLAKAIFRMLKNEIESKFIYKIGAFLMKKLFTDLRKKLNPDESGGAPLLGVNGVVIVAHGKSSSTAIYNALRIAGKLAKSGLVEQIAAHMQSIKDKMESEQEKSEV